MSFPSVCLLFRLQCLPGVLRYVSVRISRRISTSSYVEDYSDFSSDFANHIALIFLQAEAERLAARAIQKAREKRKKAGEVGGYYSSTTSSSSSAYSGGWHSASSLDTSDEEYARVIAGDEEEEDKLMAMFEDADADKSGSLQKSEFLRIMSEVIHKQSSGVGSGGGEESKEVVERVQKLEKKVEMVNRKLDRVLEILAEK